MASSVHPARQSIAAIETRFSPWSLAITPWVIVPAIVVGNGINWVLPHVVPFAWIGSWLAQGLLVFVAVRNRPRAAFGIGYLAGFLSLGLAFHWAPQALGVCMDAPPWLSYLIFIVLTAWESLPFAIFAYVVSVAARQGSRGLWIIPLSWVALEHWWPRVFPWMLGYSQLEALPLLQIADITGACGISFCVVAGSSLPAAYAIHLQHREKLGDRNWFLSYVGFVSVLLIAVLAYGYLQIEYWNGSRPGQRSLRLAAIQVNVGQMGAEKKLLELTEQVKDQVDLVCWPESAMGNFPEGMQQFRDDTQVKHLSPGVQQSMRPTQGTNCEILAGGQSFPPHATEEGPFQMTAYLIDRQEKVLGVYHKRSLIPFGEYMPGEQYIPVLRDWATLRSKIEPGKSIEPLVTSQGVKLGVIICYEDLLRGNVLQMASAGGEVLISLINDGSFENPLTLQQHRRLSTLRAVEHRRFLVRCAGTGITCVIDPTGKVVAELPIHAEDVIVQTVYLNGQTSIYARYGEWFPWLCTLCMVGTTGFWVRSRWAKPTC